MTVWKPVGAHQELVFHLRNQLVYQFWLATATSTAATATAGTAATT